MAKTTKRIVSLVIVAMLLAAMVPFTAFAANSSLTLSMSKDGFTYTVYQVATLDTTTGGYTLKTTDAGIVAAMKTKNQTGADFLAALDAATNPGSVAGTVSNGSSFTTSTMGIYYAKATAWPDGVQRKSNTVVVPKYNKGEKTWEFTDASIDLSTNGKAVSGDIFVDKGFDTVNDKAPKFKGQGDVVTYTLEATVVGSIDQKAKKYVIYDKMSKGLTYNKDAKVYYLDDAGNAGNAVNAQFDVDFTKTNAKLTDEYKDGTYITVTAKPETLGGTEFYAAKKVRVVYTATVNNEAVVGNPGNPNTDGLEYKNAADQSDDVKGPTVIVYTYNIEVEKVDASNGNAPLAGATFGLYSDSNATTEIASGTSVISGNKAIVTFKAGSDANAIRLAPGKYYVKEKEAPEGYNLNTTIYEVTVTGDTTAAGGVQGLRSAIPNTISKLPQTGGAGTMMFTILGGSLILVAGVLFVVFMKKRSSK
jgi:fimbrial isopeptide formation D2 family protein/LPXTG-motif cell wall-anchored protein